MSRLELYSRPLIAFDASNREHRGYYFQFLELGAWGRCPYRFIVPDDHGNLVTMIQRKLIEYYVNKEFKSVAKKPQVLVRQKKMKVVDK